MDSSSDEEIGLSAASYSAACLSDAICRPQDYVRAVTELKMILGRAFQTAHRSLQKQLTDDVVRAVVHCSW